MRLVQLNAAALVISLAVRAQGQAGAPTPKDTLCYTTFNALQPSFASIRRPLGDAVRVGDCLRAAAIAQSSLLAARRWTYNRDREWNQKREREALQTTRDQTASVAGEGASTVEPIEAAGGSVGAVGSEGGSSAVTTLALNPALLLVSPGDPAAIARWSRFTDFSILVPASEADKDEDGDVDYIGVRWRINVTGLSDGSTLLNAVQAAFNAILEESRTEAFALDTVLRALPDSSLKTCLDAILRAGQTGKLPDELSAAFDAAATACNGAGILKRQSVELYKQLDTDIQKARVAADSRYFGLDLRGDFGDLKRFGVDTLKGRSVTLSVAYGKRFPYLNSEASNGIRLNLGARYFEPNGAMTSRIAATGGMAYEINRYYQHQRLSLVGGLEFEADNKKEKDSDSAAGDFIAFHTSLNVPLAGTTSVTVSLSAPIVGANKLGPTLSVKANWRLLWSS